MGAAVMDVATDAVFVFEAETRRLLHANRAFLRLLGYAADEVAALRIEDVVASGPQSIQRNLERLHSEGQLILGVRPYRRKDGSIVEMDTAITMTVVKGRRLICAVTRDLSERRMAAQSLRESEERFRKLAEAAFEGIAISEHGRFLDANARMAEILGGTLPDVLGRPVSDFVAPESLEKVVEHIRSGSEEPYEHLARRVDGSTFPVEVQAKAITYQGRPMRVTAIRDISARKRLEEQLRLAQRMESVGRLAGGIAHDFNNLLTVILSSAKIMMASPRSEVDREDLAHIDRAAERAAELTRQLLAFARKRIVEPQSVDLNEITASVEKILRRLIGEDIKIVTLAGRDLGWIRADPGQVEQVLMNLAVNARDAMQSGGRLTIETANVTLDEAHARRHPEVIAGEYVKVSVSDTGQGMDDATLTHIFEPFFTTKGAGQGTGLGLATCYGIVRQAGGLIWAYSEPNKGTTFEVYFPRERAPQPPRHKPAALGSPRGRESLLIVEDEPMVRAVAVRILREHGYLVHEAASAAEALERFAELEGRVDLVVTDVVMPGGSGKELGNELLKRKPDIKIIFASGYTENTVVHQGVVDAGTHFLPKPYGPAELARRVREVLDAPS
jgi:PAS domain S-box-containing protein